MSHGLMHRSNKLDGKDWRKGDPGGDWGAREKKTVGKNIKEECLVEGRESSQG